MINTKTDFLREVEKILYDTDPAYTCCNENEIFDEYSFETRLIANDYVDHDYPLLPTMRKVFNETFSGEYDEERLLEAYRKINLNIG